MKILLVTDAWEPQTNGVVTTLKNLVKRLEQDHHDITVIHPGDFWGFGLPGYREIKMSFPRHQQIRSILKQGWDAIHIATLEGTLGYSFAKVCHKHKFRYTASLHTKIPEFVNSRLPFIPVSAGWRWMKHRFRHAQNILVPTKTMANELIDHGFSQNITVWTRGTDRDIFSPQLKKIKPITLLCVSRISPEKNLEDYFNLYMPGVKKIMVGDGPYLEKYKKLYPDVEFVGKKTGKQLAEYYQAADVFVFPSKTDTFGVVMIESMSCGTPVAAYPVTGPIDVVDTGITGYTNENLPQAIHDCLTLDRDRVYQGGLKWDWNDCKYQFLQTLIAP